MVDRWACMWAVDVLQAAGYAVIWTACMCKVVCAPCDERIIKLPIYSQYFAPYNLVIKAQAWHRCPHSMLPLAFEDSR